ncbi:MAG: 3-dehydroquinate synthase [Anaerolineales bacterium]|nr:3-dehydroquinate synthase [Anaerolineales bacterium]
MANLNVILVGPPGAGKTSVGKALAARLGWPFVDVDTLIATRAGKPIPAIFAEDGEAAFRGYEQEQIALVAARGGHVIAPGGGALLNAVNRATLERGGVLLCLRARPEVLLSRVAGSDRPLLQGDPAARLAALLAERAPLYDSIVEQVDTSDLKVAAVADLIAGRLAARDLRITAPGFEHTVALGYGLLGDLTPLLADRGLGRPAALVCDDVVAAQPWLRAVDAPRVIVPTGEQHKTLDTIRLMYERFLELGLDRGSLVVAVGGGVVGDMTGFAAATFMRGVRWVNVPTTLLAMVDASLGGKTGVDLPQGKNLVGAFHPPSLIVSDPLTLNTLPEAERRAGLAEAIKHGVIADPELWRQYVERPMLGGVDQLERAIAVKVQVVSEDPYERGRRATLNLGHTIGHGVESASGYRLRHGEAIAVGLVAEARLAVALGLAEAGLGEALGGVLARAGLPVAAPGLDPEDVRLAMSSDKKKTGGRLKFALPAAIGDVRWGIEVPDALLAAELRHLTQP